MVENSWRETRTGKIVFWFFLFALFLVYSAQGMFAELEPASVDNKDIKVKSLTTLLKDKEILVGPNHKAVRLVENEQLIEKGIGVMQKIVDHIPQYKHVQSWTFGVIPDDEAFGALTELGGSVVVGRRTIENHSLDEIAFAIGHEMTHCVLEHKGKPELGLVGKLLLFDAKLTREQELQVDEYAVVFMDRACFEMTGAIQYLRSLAGTYDTTSPFSLHPPISERVRNVIRVEQERIGGGTAEVVSSLELSPKATTYRVGDIIKAKFAIKNKSGGCIHMKTLTVGGRLNGDCPQGTCPDFEFQKGINLCSGDSYEYMGELQLVKPGDYHFFIGYEPRYGDWNTVVQTAPSVVNTININVSCPCSCDLKGTQIDFTKFGWVNPLFAQYMYISSFGCFMDSKYPKEAGTHLGFDLLGPSNSPIEVGSPVFSISRGMVVDKLKTDSISDVYNSAICVIDNQGFAVIYGHVRDPLKGSLVDINDKVFPGQQIAEIGPIAYKGAWHVPHLHLGINIKGHGYFYYPDRKGWGIAKDASDKDIADKGWIDPIFYLCEHAPKDTTELDGLATALVMDRSGSMRGEKLKRAQEAAYVYVDTCAESQDMVSLVAFHTTAQSIMDPVYINDGRETLRQSILSLSSGGSTNMGSGLTIAFDHLSSSYLKNKTAVLLSDGRHNTGTYEPEVAKFEQNGWPISTVAFGMDADQELLTQIAYRTGGDFFPASISDISRVYHRINVQAHNGSVLRSYSDFLRPSKTLRYRIPVETDMEKIGFFTSWQGSSMEISLLSPTRTRVNSANWREYGRHVQGATHSLFEIDNPQTGEWQVEIVGCDLPSQGEQINFHCYCESDMLSNILGFQPNYRRNQKVHVGVKLAEVVNGRLAPLKGAMVKAEIKKPSTSLTQLARRNISSIGNLREIRAKDLIEIAKEISKLTRRIDLYDDGNHGDNNPGDGIYANTYSDNTINGPYIVTVDFKGLTSQGKAVTRTLQESFQVGPIEQNPLTVSEFLNLLAQKTTGHDISLPKKIDEKKTKNVIDSIFDIFKKR